MICITSTSTTQILRKQTLMPSLTQCKFNSINCLKDFKVLFCVVPEYGPKCFAGTGPNTCTFALEDKISNGVQGWVRVISLHRLLFLATAVFWCCCGWKRRGQLLSTFCLWDLSLYAPESYIFQSRLYLSFWSKYKIPLLSPSMCPGPHALALQRSNSIPWELQSLWET